MSEIIDAIGWIGSSAYAIYLIPQVIMCVKNGHARGFSRGFSFLTLMGASLSMVYSISQKDYILLLNFGCSILLSAVVLIYSFSERKKN